MASGSADVASDSGRGEQRRGLVGGTHRRVADSLDQTATGGSLPSWVALRSLAASATSSSGGNFRRGSRNPDEVGETRKRTRASRQLAGRLARGELTDLGLSAGDRGGSGSGQDERSSDRRAATSAARRGAVRLSACARSASRRPGLDVQSFSGPARSRLSRLRRDAARAQQQRTRVLVGICQVFCDLAIFSRTCHASSSSV